MGYARLNFATSVTTAQAMYDVVRCINGTNTTTADLAYASVGNSELVNTLAENWTVVYGTVAATTTSYVVSSPCETAGKTHYARLQMYGGNWDTDATFVAATTNGIGVNTISAATSATSVSNPTAYGATGGQSIVKVNATNANIYVHWSKHHIVLYGGSGTSSTTQFLGTFEYPETSLTQFTNTSPIIQYGFNYNHATTFYSTQTGGSVANPSGIIFQGIDMHVPSAGTTYGVYIPSIVATGSTATGFGTVTVEFSPVFTLNASGQNAYPLMPIYWQSPALGLPTINISTLTGVYRIATNASTAEDVFTVGADSYVYLPIGTTISATGASVKGGWALLKK